MAESPTLKSSLLSHLFQKCPQKTCAVDFGGQAFPKSGSLVEPFFVGAAFLPAAMIEAKSLSHNSLRAGRRSAPQRLGGANWLEIHEPE
jgi:hypothetical protein